MAEALTALRGGSAYLDAGVFIGHLLRGHRFHSSCREFLNRAMDDPRIALATASLTLDEVAIVVLQELVAEPPYNITTNRTTYLQRNPAAVRQLGRDLRPQLITVSQACVVSAVTNDDVLSMAANIEAYGLLPRDAIHVAVAQRLGIDSIVSDDDAFDRVPGITLYKPEPGP